MSAKSSSPQRSQREAAKDAEKNFDPPRLCELCEVVFAASAVKGFGFSSVTPCAFRDGDLLPRRAMRRGSKAHERTFYESPESG
jgi:hypothetical protein